MIFSSNLPHCQDQSPALILTNKHSPPVTPILSISALQTPPLHFLRSYANNPLIAPPCHWPSSPSYPHLSPYPEPKALQWLPLSLRGKATVPSFSVPHILTSILSLLFLKHTGPTLLQGCCVTLLDSWEQSFNNSHCGAWHAHLWDCVDVSIFAWAGGQGRRGLLDTRWGRSHSCIRRGQGRSLRTSK